MATLDAAPINAGGMTIYRAAPAELAPWRNANALAMETRLDRARFAALVLAAENYLHGGYPLAALTTAEVYKLGLMPAGWIVVPKKAEPPWDEIILEDPTVWGVQALSGEAIVVRVVCKTAPGKQADTARELRERVKKAFDSAGVAVATFKEDTSAA